MFLKSLWNFWSGGSPGNGMNECLSRRLRFGAVSITGNFRENNEDRYRIDPQGRYFIVADGMGGQCAGEKASELATELVPRRLEQLLNFVDDPPEKVPAAIDDAVGKANDEIMALGELDPAFHSMGTTIALAVADGDSLYVAGIGDSRVYRLHGGQLEQLTKDHSLSEALREAGTISKEEAATHRYKHVLVRYLGAKEGGLGANARRIHPAPGDRFLLCSDGVTDGLADESLVELLQTHADPQEAADAIVAAALDGGSRDNITCVVIAVD